MDPSPRRPQIIGLSGRPDRAYTAVFDAVLDLEIRVSPGDKRKTRLEQHTEIDYRLRGDPRVSVFVDRVSTSRRVNGKPRGEATMSGAGLRSVEGGKIIDVRFAEASDKLRTMLEGRFRRALYTVELDSFGAENERAPSAHPGAKEAEHLVRFTRIFHAPYRTDRPLWEAPAELTYRDQVALGRLRYIRGRPRPDGRISVDVRGTMRSTGKLGTFDSEIVYKVIGSEMYDARLGDYATGTLIFQMTVNVSGANAVFGTGQGRIEARLKPRALPAS